MARAAIPGSLGVQLLPVAGVQATNAQAQLYIIDHLHPGTVIHRLIEVSNTTTSTMPIAIYPAAATIIDGAFVGSAGHTRNNLSTWTSVSPGTYYLPAGGDLTARVKIAVPRDASQGEQYAVVWAETRSTPTSGEGVTEISRVGIRVYLSVGPGGAPPSKFSITPLTAGRTANGRPMIVATVHNTGGLALNIYGTLKLTGGPGGLRAGPFPAHLGGTLAIGGTEHVNIVLDKQLPVGPWNAQITLRSGLITKSARENITFPTTTTTASVSTYLASGALAVGLLGLAILLVVTRRRRNPHDNRRSRDGLPRRFRAGATRIAHDVPAAALSLADLPAQLVNPVAVDEKASPLSDSVDGSPPTEASNRG